MKDILKTLRLTDTLITELQMTNSDFVAKLRDHVEEGRTGMFSDPFEAFRRTDKEFKGRVDQHSFEIRKRRRFFENQTALAKATGTFSEQNGKLIIEMHITVLKEFLFLFYGVALIIYAIVILSVLFSHSVGTDSGFFFVLPFIIFHATLMFAIPYFLSRKSVSRLKYYLDREFYYLTKPNR